ncbi:MAG: Gfo/Idh/MocA family oxidoreductase [Clostridia bacterium]|nr:Gfo/Idh/MocA family oxidoreductase [Clostridia bacterium]
MEKIKVGHIGTKHDHSRAKLEAIRKFPHLFEVVGIVPETPEIAEKIKNDAVYGGIPIMTEEELFAVPDLKLVLLEGYELESVAAAQRCIDHGLHIHLDKPGGEDIDAYQKLLADAKRKGLIVQLGYMYRYNPAVNYLDTLIADGRIGEITAIDTQMSTQHAAAKVKWLAGFKGGVMFWLGCHLVDLIFRYAGVPEEIIPMNNRSGFSCPETYDNTFAIMKYPKFIATIRVNSTEVNGFGRRQLVVCGKEGTVEIKPLEGPTKMTYADRRHSAAGPYNDLKMDIPFLPPTGRYDVMVKDLYRYIMGTKENPYSYEYEFQLQRMVLAACGFDIDFKTPIEL